jgi:hypothetical protein
LLELSQKPVYGLYVKWTLIIAIQMTTMCKIINVMYDGICVLCISVKKKKKKNRIMNELSSS